MRQNSISHVDELVQTILKVRIYNYSKEKIFTADDKFIDWQ